MSLFSNRMAIGYMAAGAALTLAGAAVISTAQAKDPATKPAAKAQAQEAPQPPQGFPGGQGGRGGFPGGPGGQGGGFPGGPGGQGMRGPMMGMMGAPATMTATDRYVFVLRGDTLYQFSTDGLKLLGKADLPRDQRGPRGPGGPGFPGQGGPPQD